jgi:chromosome segregation ATPase
VYIEQLENNYVEEIHLYYQMLYEEEEVSQYTLSTVINVLSDRIYDLEEQLWNSATEQEYMEASLGLNKEYLLYAISQSEEAKEDAEKCRNTYQSIINWYEQFYSTVNQRINDKQSIIDNLQREYKKIEIQNTEAQIIQETNKKLISSYENKIKKQKDWENEKKTMTDELNKLRLNIIKYENEYEEDTKKKNEELNEVNKKIQEEIVLLEKELEDTSETNEILSKRVMEYELKYEELKQEYLEAIKTLEIAQEKGSVTEDEFKRIADMHASLFGHNNNKQKIKYIDQIKQENLKLKSNNATLSVRNKQLTRQALALEKELDAFRAIPSSMKKVGHYTRMMPSSVLSEKENSLSPENKNYL